MTRSIIARALLLAFAAAAGVRVAAQGEAIATVKKPTGPSRPAPRTADGKADLWGIWSPDPHFIYDINEALRPGDTLPLQAWALKQTIERQSKDDPEANCLPTGVPRMNPYPWRMVQSSTDKPESHIFILFEGNIHSYRQIFMDGRKHPADPDPTWYGHSIGRFDGNTLIVDTVGFNDKFWFDFKGHPHTERLHIVERYTRKDFNTLVNQITIDDPGAYSRAFTVTFTAELAPPGDELLEYICQENNQDVEHIHGPTQPGGDPERPLGTLKSR